MTAADSTENVCIYNMDLCQSFSLYVNGWYLLTIEPGALVTIPLSIMCLASYQYKYQGVRVLSNCPLLDITAVTFELNYYEQLCLPYGVYCNTESIVSALNSQIRMRGEKGSYMYMFHCKKGKLIFEVLQNYKKGCTITVTPCNHFLGLLKQADVPLRARKQIEFPSIISNLIL